MDNKIEIKRRFKSKFYIKSIPIILQYQFFSRLFLGIIVFLLNKLGIFILNSTGKFSINTGDYSFLFTTWQGYTLIGIGLITLLIYFTFDLNTRIIFSNRLLNNQDTKILNIIKDGFFSIRKFLSLKGLIIIIFVTIVTPLLDFGSTVSLTKNLYIPNFIASVIESNIIYLIIYLIIIIILARIIIKNIFVLHSILIDKNSIKISIKKSNKIIKKHFWNLSKEMLVYVLKVLLFNAFVAVFTFALPIFVFKDIKLPLYIERFASISFLILNTIIFSFLNLVLSSIFMIKLTALYYKYTEKDLLYTIEKDNQKKIPKFTYLIIIVFLLLFSGTLSQYFDDVFPKKSTVEIIGHRGGGFDVAENTLKGVEFAYNNGAYGTEIDIQRTKDGFYIVNHDTTFKRVAGINKKSHEMTLKEIKTLKISTTTDKTSYEVATLDEMLNFSKNKLKLFIELKGATADEKMVDDVVELIKKYDMIDQAIIISLKYDLIKYTEEKYSEILTGYLTFANYGNIENIEADYIGLEEIAATKPKIDAINNQNKKVLVWTTNIEESQIKFMKLNIEAIITDNILQANLVKQNLNLRTDLEIVLDWILSNLI